jgi:bifunctional non-homologous end joining protein LigD
VACGRREPAPSAYAKKLAQQLAREAPDTVTAVMAKNQHTNRVFIDWSRHTGLSR